METLSYAVSIDRLPDGRPRLDILKARGAAALLSWRGEIARRVIAWSGLRHGQALDKHRVRELAIVGAAAQQSVDGERCTKLERLIGERRGEHLSQSELVALCLSHCPGLSEYAVTRQLHALAEAGTVQRIVIDEETIFYDADTSAHLHVYDPDTKTLRDAPTSGILVAVAADAQKKGRHGGCRPLSSDVGSL